MNNILKHLKYFFAGLVFTAVVGLLVYPLTFVPVQMAVCTLMIIIGIYLMGKGIMEE